MSELHFHSIQDYKINVNGIEIKPVSEETRSFEVIGGEEHGLLDGLNVEAIQSLIDKVSEETQGRFKADTVILPGRFIKYGCLFFTKRKRRANFKPHMRRRLRAINRGRR